MSSSVTTASLEAKSIKANTMKDISFAEKFGYEQPKETLASLKARGVKKEVWGQEFFDKGDTCDKEGCDMKFARACFKQKHYHQNTCGNNGGQRNKDETTGKAIVDLTPEEKTQRKTIAKDKREGKATTTKTTTKISAVEMKLAKKVWAMMEAKKLPIQAKGLEQIRKLMEKKAVANLPITFRGKGGWTFPGEQAEVKPLIAFVIEFYKEKGIAFTEEEEEEEEEELCREGRNLTASEKAAAIAFGITILQIPKVTKRKTLEKPNKKTTHYSTHKQEWAEWSHSWDVASGWGGNPMCWDR
jgi:hypothetical protein